MLKADLHLHAKEDPKDTITYTSKDIIRYAAKLKFEVLSITLHNKVFYTKDLVRYAKNKGILLIPGVERTIKGKHVLLYNISEKEKKKINDFIDIENIKDHAIVCAAHPYYFYKTCLESDLEKNIKLFNAIEYCHFYYRFLNPNIRAKKIAKKYNLPFLGNSDSHHLWQMGYTYSLFDCPKTKDDILESIRKSKVNLISRSLPFKTFFKFVLSFI